MINNGPLGIDHALVTVRDLSRTAAKYEALGFDPTPQTAHPWGTINRLVMFDGNFIELISIGNRDLFETDTTGGGALFGRHLNNFLRATEGISYVALHSKDAERDKQDIEKRGLTATGTVHFRRCVTPPDGEPDEAVVSLVMYTNNTCFNVSHFLCQQHKPHLVFNPMWAHHRNGAKRIRRVIYAARSPETLRSRFSMLYGEDNIHHLPGGFEVPTPGGSFQILDAKTIRKAFPAATLPENIGDPPAAIGITVETNDLASVKRLADDASCGAVFRDNSVLIPADFCGNTVVEFVPVA